MKNQLAAIALLIAAPVFAAQRGALDLYNEGVGALRRGELREAESTLREAASALGAPKWKVSTAVVLKAARSGVMTGLLLALARVSGEIAPLLFTALNNQFFSLDMNKPMANLPVVIFQFAMSPYDNWVNLAWGGALLITLTVLALNIVARVVFREKVAV